ncbi:MAG: glycosyltransferase family 4 protein [Anaerolineae bacterium]
MPTINPPRVGYVLKMYPRFSETFILNEILAHQVAGLDLHIFSLRQPSDGRFHEALAQVRAPVSYVPVNRAHKISEMWHLLAEAAAEFPDWQKMLPGLFNEAPDDVYQAILLARQVRDSGITHLHAHFGSMATSVARLAGGLTGVPYSFTAHAKDIFHDSVQPDDLRRKLRDAAAVVTVSEYNLAHLRQHFGDAARTVRCIYNGLALEQFPYEAPLNRPPRLVTVGRLVEKKGFPDFIAACRLLADLGYDFSADIVGSGPLEAALAGQIERLGLAGRVNLVGPRPQGEVKQWVQQAAAFAAPCVVGEDGNRDGLPTVLLEAMALGTPCVSTDVTGIPEVVRSGETGLLVPQHNPEALAGALANLLDDAALRVRLAANARRLIEEQFDIRHNAAQIRSLFAPAPTEETYPAAQPAIRPFVNSSIRKFAPEVL